MSTPNSAESRRENSPQSLSRSLWKLYT